MWYEVQSSAHLPQSLDSTHHGVIERKSIQPTTVTNKKLSYRRGTAQRAVSVKTVLNVAEMFVELHLISPAWSEFFPFFLFSKPAYLRSSLHACHSTRSLRLSNTNLLSAPFVCTSFGSRSFSVAAPKIWNSLPLSLRTCTSPDTFRRHLKTHYCQQAVQST